MPYHCKFYLTGADLSADRLSKNPTARPERPVVPVFHSQPASLTSWLNME